MEDKIQLVTSLLKVVIAGGAIALAACVVVGFIVLVRSIA